MSIIFRTVLASATMFAVMTLSSLAQAQEVTINAVFFTPAQVSYAKSFMNYVTKVNQRGKGVIQIKVRGARRSCPLDNSARRRKTA